MATFIYNNFSKSQCLLIQAKIITLNIKILLCRKFVNDTLTIYFKLNLEAK